MPLDEELFTRQLPTDRFREQTDPVLQLEEINVNFDGFQALTNLSLQIGVGELRCVIGPNGAGKTTLMDVSLRARLNSEQADRISETLRLLRLEGERYRPAGLLSHGQKQFLEIGMLLVQEPHLLLLDEPAAGMTDAETEYTAELFRTLAGQHSLMVVEHDMGFVETIADRVTVLHQGQVLAEGSLREVQANEQVIEVYLGR